MRTNSLRLSWGAGTLYSKGIEKAHWLLNEEFRGSVWDRYTFLLGDMADFNPEDAFNKVKALLEESEYFGTVAGIGGPQNEAGSSYSSCSELKLRRILRWA